MNWCFDFLSGIHFLTCDLYQAHLTPVFTHILLLLLAHILPYTSLMSSLLLPQDSLKREYYANPIDKATPEEPAIIALSSELLRILISTLHYSASHVLILFQHPPTFFPGFLLMFCELEIFCPGQLLESKKDYFRQKIVPCCCYCSSLVVRETGRG